MAELLERLKTNRKTLRSAVTKLVNNIELNLKNENIDLVTLEEDLKLLEIKSKNLSDIDKEMEPLIPLKDFETETNLVYEYADKISLSSFRAHKKLKENIVNDSKNTSNTNSESLPNINGKNQFVKLPKLEIIKFDGDISKFTSFWNSFKTAIDDNNCLSNIQKMNYLKSFLSSRALNSIEGLEISDENYDQAVEILHARFGQKDIIINHHMNKLLNLSPVFKSSDIFRLKRLYEEIEINVRALNALGLKENSYSAMLIAVILKIIPNDLALEFNRKNSSDCQSQNINDLLEFMQNEIVSRERTFSFSDRSKQNNSFSSFTSNKTRYRGKNTDSTSSALELITAVENDRKKKCLFCQKENHSSDFCRSFNVTQRRKMLSSQGRCFLCLGVGHVMRKCLKFDTLNCSHCLGKHSSVICYKFNATKKDKQPESKVDSQSEQKSEIVSAVSHTGKNQILLQTCCVKLRNKNKENISRMLMDCGSMRTFTCEDVVKKLNLKVIRKEKLAVFTFGSKKPIEKIFDVVKVTVENKNSPESKIQLEALVTENISATNIPPPDKTKLEQLKCLQNLTLADSPSCKEPITVLVGADYYFDIVKGNIKRVDKNLVAVETIFGWCLQGTKSENYSSLNMNIIVNENVIGEQIEKFWNLEASGLVNLKEDLDPSENEVMKRFESEVKFENNRYKVKLPWKLDKHQLRDNRKVALGRFLKLKNRFTKNPELFFEYKNVLQDYLSENIIELVENEDKDCVAFYLPHREVIKKDRATSKLRIVYDASSHDFDSPSLNSCLNTGPNLYQDIFHILCRFRFHTVAFTADMKQAFLQILLDEEDRDVTRFLFTENPFDETAPLQTFRFTRVLFGLNSSPFLLAAVIKHHLKKFSQKYPETVNFLRENIYVDDIIGSHPSVEKALSVCLESVKIFQDATMHLHKWHTNSENLNELWVTKNINPKNSKSFEETSSPNKVLGLGWNNLNDTLYFDARDLTKFVENKIDSKRFVLQVLGRIFDPIGFLGPFTIRIKCLMQKIWMSGIDWDDSLPSDLKLLWRNWCNEVPLLSDFSIPRHYFSEISQFEISNLQLHLFSDSSIKAFATVAYFRVVTPEGEIKTVFVASKNRVAPLKSLTLPRLELMAALLSAKLSENILEALKINIPCFYWTDSKITYFWIRGSPEKFKPFVKNRVEEIHKLSSPSNWHYCPGKCNPADLPSRGVSISQLSSSEIWWHGPPWLQNLEESWPKSENLNVVGEELEYRVHKNHAQQFKIAIKNEDLIDLSKFSTLLKPLRILSWVKRFTHNCKDSSKISGPLTGQELIEAEEFLIKGIQLKNYQEEIDTLFRGDPVKKDSKIYSLCPYLDENKLIRIKSRLSEGDLSFDEINPILLPKNEKFTELLVMQKHQKLMHSGVSLTLVEIRKKFWIPQGRQLVKRIIGKCLVCRRYNAKPADQCTGQLPIDRISEPPLCTVTWKLIVERAPWWRAFFKRLKNLCTEWKLQLFVKFELIHISL